MCKVFKDCRNKFKFVYRFDIAFVDSCEDSRKGSTVYVGKLAKFV